MQLRLTLSHVYLKAAMLGCGFAAALCIVAVPARAAFIGTVHIQFQSGGQSGSYDVSIPGNADSYSWALPSAVEIYSTENPGIAIATLQGLNLYLDGDPGVSLGFNVAVGPSPTLITFSSAVVAFGAITNPLGFATAALTVTDVDSDGASATGALPGTTAYQAIYNGSTVFANLISPVIAAVDSSALGSGRAPVAGTVVIPGSVTSIQSQFSFTLSANDLASGTSRFNITPEPATFVLLVIGASVLAIPALRRWRRKA